MMNLFGDGHTVETKHVKSPKAYVVEADKKHWLFQAEVSLFHV